MKPLHSLREALEDPDLLGGALPGESWRTWRIMLIAAMGEPLVDDERPVFESLTGRAREPLVQVEEFWGVVGRRGGKTRAAGTVAVYVGGLCEHDYLAPGERGVLPILAASTDQAQRAYQHAKGILEASPMLSALIMGEPTADTIRLATGIDIQVKAANFRTVRGITAPAAICDEVAFWNIEGSANPDAEIIGALRPALATTGGPLIVISSPHARRGEVYVTWRRDYGPAGDAAVLVAKGPSRAFNPTLAETVVARAYVRDAAAAAAEYGGEFRNDIDGFVSREIVEACVVLGVRERGYNSHHTYEAFVDPSGGINDSMTLAIGHREAENVVLDALRERKAPFSPESVVKEFADLLGTYGLMRVTGDRYGGEWPRELFRKFGINYVLAEHNRSELYRDLLATLNSGRIELLDNPVLVSQIVSLERRMSRAGRESIDHPPNGHDDVANVAAGVASILIADNGLAVWCKLGLAS